MCPAATFTSYRVDRSVCLLALSTSLPLCILVLRMDLLEEILAAAPAQDDLVLDDTDLEWLEELQPPALSSDPRRLHMICGDSIAKRAPLTAGGSDDILSLATSGHTWRLLLDDVSEYVQTWTFEAEERHLQIGNVAIWLTGNDVYPRHHTSEPIAGLRERCEALRDAVIGAISALHTVARTVLVLGPLPRRMDLSRPWEQTPAYHLERHIRTFIAELDDVCLLQLGRLLCTRKRSRHLVQDVDYFLQDGVHLSRRGYDRLLPRFPSWLAA